MLGAVLGATLVTGGILLYQRLSAPPEPARPPAPAPAAPRLPCVPIAARPSLPAPPPVPTIEVRDNAAPAPAAPAPAAPAPAAAPDAASPPASPAPAAEPPADPERDRRIVVPYRGDGRRILVSVAVNGGGAVTMAVDTGAPATVISHRLADKLGILRDDDGKVLTRAHGIGGATPALFVALDSLTLGDAREEFVPATVAPINTDEFEGLLGMDFVSTFSMKIDAEQKALILTKPERGGTTPGGHDAAWWRRVFAEFSGQRRRWKDFVTHIDERLRSSEVSEGVDIEHVKRLREIAARQIGEAEKLYLRLERHASNHAVPREWR
jgi:clan AA aspartic protease (TIGR02281 family)